MRIMIVLFVLCLALPVHAQGTPPAQADGTTIADIVFKEIEKRAIEEFYKHVPGARPEESEDADKGGKGKGDKHKGAKGNGRGNGLPPGLTKRDQLPPGLAKRGNHLPPGLMKGDLPPELEAKLPPVAHGTERVIVDNDVLLVQKGTNLILDVLEGVLRGQ